MTPERTGCTTARIGFAVLQASMRAAALAALLLLWLAAGSGGTARAHAWLESAEPAADGRVAAAPAYVELVFSERLDAGGARLQVLDESSGSVSEREPERTRQGKGLRLALPELDEGRYTVSYAVISADGHPVSGAYVFTVGDPPPAAPEGGEAAPAAPDSGHAGHGASADGRLTTADFLLYASRILHYAALLGLCGLLLWSTRRSAPEAARRTADGWLQAAGRAMLLAAIAYAALHLRRLAPGEPYGEWLQLAGGSAAGRLYAAQLALACLAPLLHRAGAAIRLLWAAAALAAEAWLGHAAAQSPAVYAAVLDAVHLAAAAVWAGGLLLLAALWRRHRPDAARFAMAFSPAALAALLLAAASGLLLLARIEPDWTRLPLTGWGVWLLVKLGLFVLVLPAAWLIRRRMRRGGLPQGALIRLELGMSAAIVLCVGVLTYLGPQPPAKPLYFHHMGTDIHVTLTIDPKQPGSNRFAVKIWLPETAGKPKSVQLRLRPPDRPDVGFIEVPLTADSEADKDALSFAGFALTTYRAQGTYLPFSGKWEAELRTVDARDDEHVVDTTFRVN